MYLTKFGIEAILAIMAALRHPHAYGEEVFIVVDEQFPQVEKQGTMFKVYVEGKVFSGEGNCAFKATCMVWEWHGREKGNFIGVEVYVPAKNMVVVGRAVPNIDQLNSLVYTVST